MGQSDRDEGGCPPIRVFDPHLQEEVVLRPIGVWLEAVVKKKNAIKVGLFKSPTGKYFLEKLPPDYPLC